MGDMRLTRHAKNRLRFISRGWSGVSEARLLELLASASEIGRDIRGNRRLRVEIGGILLTVVVDDRRGVIITIWREE